MPFSTISLGSSANDGTGTDARTAGQYIDDIINAANYGQFQGFKNRLLNGAFRFNQRALASNADDTYCLDGFYVLTQTGAIAASQLTDPENGAPNGIRLTQSQVSAQRMGLGQIIESANCRDLRGASVVVSGRVRLSTSANVRYAILEWTGTVDAPTSDVVNDWTSGTYTAGNFFVSTTTNVLAVGSVACAANTWRDLTALVATCGASMNNLIVVAWTEGTAAQNVTLDFNRLQLEPGAKATIFETMPVGVEYERCLRYYFKTFALATTPAQNVGADSGEIDFLAGKAGATAQYGFFEFPVPMLKTPSLTGYNPAAGNAQVRDKTAAADCSSTAFENTSPKGFRIAATGNASTAVGNKLGLHVTAAAEL